MKSVAIFLLASIALAQKPSFRMNQVQVTGSHNSYKQAIDPALFKFLTQEAGKQMEALEYAHGSLEEQLNLGLRALEIDVVNDPKGGHYASPFGLKLESRQHLAPGPPYDPMGLMRKPGLKVLHVPDIDFRSNVYTLQQELALLKSWSLRHPDHLPIMVTMNAKDSGLRRSGFVTPVMFNRAAFDAWDKELLTGLGRENLITPDDLRGTHPTLESAALSQDWPTLDQARGKFFFVLDEENPKRAMYIAGHPSLRNRVMFVNAPEGSPEAAIRILNEPESDWSYIQYLVRNGYYVRTRADADTVEARQNDYTRQCFAVVSGAQVISTDYYVPDPNINKTYQFLMQPRWNPLLLPSQRPLPVLEEKTATQQATPIPPLPAQTR